MSVIWNAINQVRSQSEFFMKILFYRYNSIIEPDILAVFREMGIDVIEYRREMTEKNLSMQERVMETGNFLLDHPVDAVFSINFYPFLSEICNIFKLRYCSWTVDSPVMELYTTSIKNPWNRTFLFDMDQYRRFHPLNENCIFYLPLGARTAPKDDLFSKTAESEKAKYSHDIAFVGSLYKEKNRYEEATGLPSETKGYLDGIMRAQELIYGYYFIPDLLDDEIVAVFKSHVKKFYTLPVGSYLSDRDTMAYLYMGCQISMMERVDTFKRLSKKFPVTIYTGSDTKDIPDIENKGLASTFKEMPLIFHESKINLNITSKSITSGLPLRIFDILSCGGFLISNYQSEIAELLTPGEDLVVYESQDQLEDLIAYYLSHDRERKEIAAHGRETLIKKYSLEHQLALLIKMSFSI